MKTCSLSSFVFSAFFNFVAYSWASGNPRSVQILIRYRRPVKENTKLRYQDIPHSFYEKQTFHNFSKRFCNLSCALKYQQNNICGSNFLILKKKYPVHLDWWVTFPCYDLFPPFSVDFQFEDITIPQTQQKILPQFD